MERDEGFCDKRMYYLKNKKVASREYENMSDVINKGHLGNQTKRKNKLRNSPKHKFELFSNQN